MCETIIALTDLLGQEHHRLLETRGQQLEPKACVDRVLACVPEDLPALKVDDLVEKGGLTFKHTFNHYEKSLLPYDPAIRQKLDRF